MTQPILPSEAEKLIKEIQKHTWEELINWVNDVIQATTQQHRNAISTVLKRPWNIIESEISARIASKDYSKIHELQTGLFGLGDVNKPAELAVLSTVNEIAKDSKFEAYIFYRYLGGKSKLRIGLIRY